MYEGRLANVSQRSRRKNFFKVISPGTSFYICITKENNMKKIPIEMPDLEPEINLLDLQDYI